MSVSFYFLSLYVLDDNSDNMAAEKNTFFFFKNVFEKFAQS